MYLNRRSLRLISLYYTGSQGVPDKRHLSYKMRVLLPENKETVNTSSYREQEISLIGTEKSPLQVQRIPEMYRQSSAWEQGFPQMGGAIVTTGTRKFLIFGSYTTAKNSFNKGGVICDK